MIDVGKMIIALRKEHGMTQAELAQRLNCSKQAISNYENNRRNPDYETLESLADVFNVPIGFLVTPEDQAKELGARFQAYSAPSIPGMQTMPYTPPRAKIPVIGVVRCGEGGLAFEEPLGYEGADVSNPEDFFYLVASGDSMEPRVFDGDYILVHRQPDVESGELAVVIVDGEEGTLKKVIKKENTIILQPYNPSHPTRVFVGAELNELVIAGKAVGMVRKW